MNHLRIINDIPHNPQFNMAADLFLMRLAEQTEQSALRLYDWEPPCITLGYMQKVERVLLLDVLKQKNIGWIKRCSTKSNLCYKKYTRKKLSKELHLILVKLQRLQQSF